ncbi:hypothetical protein NST46_03345 [Oceanobacillus sp. FSL W7-1309]|uniref:hypothetical protein n=1 Tax=Oceanobacillus sp. FSL W7-1309 TaxID=2954539 RepID=UPI0030F8B81B
MITTTSVANAIMITIVSKTDIGNTSLRYSISHDTITAKSAPTSHEKKQLLHVIIIP